MWRSKKLIVAIVLAGVLLFGGLGGIALADDNEDEGHPGPAFGALWDRVAAILQDDGVDVTSDQLKDAFTQAQGEMRTEAMQNRLQYLVEQGTITQEQADDYQEWREARPDGPMKFGGRAPGGFRGMCGPCPPAE